MGSRLVRESSRRLLRLRRDPLDRRGPERTAVSFLASAIVHALIAMFLFSIATSSPEQSPESSTGGIIVTVSSRPVPTSAPASVAKAAAPAPHAIPHPRVLHELAKFAPTAPPNPTPAPETSVAPNPLPTQAVIAVSPAPIPQAVPTSVPTAAVVAVSIKAPPTTAPSPKPSAAPKAPAATPAPEPSVIAATAAPIVAMASPVPVSSPGIASQVKIENRAPQRGTAPTPGPKVAGSPGPRAVAPVKTVAVPRPVQPLPGTPRPAPAAAGAKHPSLNERLRSLIPTSAPSTPKPPTSSWRVGNIVGTPEPEPTPPPDVIAATKFLYVENVGSQRWKQSWLGTAPEERYVKVYVTSVKRVGFIKWCTGWVLRAPIAGSQKWIVEPNESFVCAGRLEPFTAPSPLPTGSP